MKYTEERLRDAAAHNTSVMGVLRYMGVEKPSPSTHTHISNRIKRFGIDTSHFTGQAHQKGRQARNRKTAAEILVVKPTGSPRTNVKFLVRSLLELDVEYKCSHCPLTDTWNDLPLTLEVDHINGDWLDNRLDNLQFLCSNCHGQKTLAPVVKW